MNIISVEHLPPLTLVSKGKALSTASATQYRISQQARNVPPLTIVSKGKAVANNAIGKGQEAKCQPPLTVIRTGKALSLPPPLTVVQKGKVFNPDSGKQSLAKAKVNRSKITSSYKKPLILKKYDNVTAPAPLFGPFKSKIPMTSKIPMRIQQEDFSRREQHFTDVDLTNNEAEWTQREYLIDDSETNDIELPQHRSLMSGNNAVESTHIFKSMPDNAINLEGPSSMMEDVFADKAVQTECFCQCYNRDSKSDSHSGMKQVIEAIAKVSGELKDLKLNITGQTATKMMAGLFPIKSNADLIKIDYNMENTENFELRLKLFLKYLKPKNSKTITTAFKELIHDDFLEDKNWDGTNNSTALDKLAFFKTILFDAWKNTAFTKDVYIGAMKEEIKKSHDRKRKRKSAVQRLMDPVLM